MAYIDPTWIADEHFEYLDANFDLSKYDSSVDRKIQAVCMSERVAVGDIPVDSITGFVDSIPLQVYGILLFKYHAFMGYWGKRNGTQDIYFMKLQALQGELAEARKDITQFTIVGFADDDTDLGSGLDTIAVRPY